MANSVKVAFFVEGLTEMLFIEKLLLEIFNEKHIAIETKAIRGGKKGSATVIESITTVKENGSKKYYVLLYDCGGDSNIRSYVNDQRPTLIKANYDLIVGLVDLYPKDRSMLRQFEMGLNYKLPQKDLPTKLIISLMEIEAWFIGEYSHFENLHTILTPQFIVENTGIDVKLSNVELIDKPAYTLDNIYRLAGLRYVKKKESIKKTVDALDYSKIYLELPDKIGQLKLLIEIIDGFVTD